MQRLHRRETARGTTRLATLVIPLGILALGACAETPTAADAVQPAVRTFGEEPDDCFFASTLRDWRPLDEQNLILFATGRRPYHVELTTPAIGLDTDVVIGVYDRDGRICPYGGDSIIVNDVVANRIMIDSIRELSDEQLTEAYVAFGVEPPAVVDDIEIEEEIDSVP